MASLRKTTKDLLSIGVLFAYIWSFVWAWSVDVEILPRFGVLFVPFVLMYAIRRLTSTGYAFLLFTLPVCVASWFLMGLFWGNTAVGFIIFLYLLYSLFAWFNDELEPKLGSAVFYLLTLAFLYAAVSGQDNAGVYQIRVIVCFLLIVCFTIIFHQMDSVDLKLYLVKNKEGSNARKIMRANNRMGIVFVCIASFAGFLAFFFPLHLIGRFFSWLGSLIPEITTDRRDEGIEFFEHLGAMFPVDVGEVADGEMGEWEPGILATVLEFMLFMLLAAAVLFCLYLVARQVKRKTKVITKTTEDTEEIEVLGSVLEDLRDLLPRFGKIRHPIRRAYEKKVNWHIKQGIIIEKHFTTEEIANKIRETEDIDELTAKYEVVRYGGNHGRYTHDGKHLPKFF